MKTQMNIGVPPSDVVKEKSDCGCGEKKDGVSCNCKNKNKIKPLEVVLVLAILGGAYYLLKK
jgi:hypothetical protein